MRALLTTTFLLASTLALVLGSQGVTAEEDAPAYTVMEDLSQAGSIRGRVRFSGVAAHARLWDVTRDFKICGNRKQTQSVRVKGDGLGDVVVTLRGITQGKAPGRGPTLSQQQCEFVPRVMAMTTGQRLTLVNRDPLPVMVTGRDQEETTVFQFLQPVEGSKHKKHIQKAGLIRVQSDDDRPWARALIYVADHPYVTATSDDGTFEFKNVPPGTWDVMAWHETLGTRLDTVTVAPREESPVAFLYGAGAP